MGQKKLKRFAELRSFPNALEYPADMKGKWNVFFGNDHPITLELACGKGEYAVGLGRLFPQKNFLGIDIKGNRMWVGAKTALNEGLSNVGFLRSQIEKLADYFNTGEVQEIWITFPDPQLNFSRMKKRLTHPRFIRLYQAVMGFNGIVHLKTDSPDLFAFTHQVIDVCGCTLIESFDNLYAQPNLAPQLSIKTHYEQLDIAKSQRIHYIAFRPDKIISDDKDILLKQMLEDAEVDKGG